MRMTLIVSLAWLALASVAQGAQALRVMGAGVHDFGGRTLTCGPGQEVGVLLREADTVVSNVRIEQCPMAVKSLADGVTIRQVVIPDRVRRADQLLARPAATLLQVGFWLGGCSGLAEFNTASGLDIGFWLPGCSYTLIGNRSNGHTQAGFLVAGHANLLQQNEALNNGKVGIYLAMTAPIVRSTVAIMGLRRNATHNWLEANTATGNGQADLAEDEPLHAGGCNENTWVSNISGTARLPEPCEEED